MLNCVCYSSTDGISYSVSGMPIWKSSIFLFNMHLKLAPRIQKKDEKANGKVDHILYLALE